MERELLGPTLVDCQTRYHPVSKKNISSLICLPAKNSRLLTAVTATAATAHAVVTADDILTDPLQAKALTVRARVWS